MPVNRNPKNRRTAQPPAAKPETPPQPDLAAQDPRPQPTENLDKETERDREIALAEAEWQNLWDATEVIDMDKW
jgi:hypothetical protein